MTESPDLFTFKGHFLEEKDLPRINTHARRVWDCMVGRHLEQPQDWDCGSGWVELNALARYLNLPHSSVTAAVRSFRFPENGGHTVEREKTDKPGLFLYRLTPNTPLGVAMAKQAAGAKGSPKGTRAYRDGRRDALLELKDKLRVKAEHNSWWLGSIQAGPDIINLLHQMIEENAND